jgi:hypothetical protein
MLDTEETIQARIDEHKALIKECNRKVKVLKQKILDEQARMVRLRLPGLPEHVYEQITVEYADYQKKNPAQLERWIRELKGDEIDRAVLKRVVVYLEKHGILDDEDLKYKMTKDRSVTLEEFEELFGQLEGMGGSRIVEQNKHGFPMFTGYFEYDGFKFIWDLMLGQGSASALMSAAHNPKRFPFLEDKKIVIPLEAS